MKKYSIPFIFLLLTITVVEGQTGSDTLEIQSKKYQHTAAFGVYIPVADFARSHVVGAGIEHSWSQHRFDSDRVTYKKFGLIISSGTRFMIGKQISTSGYDYRYGNYLSIYSMPGIIYRPAKKGFLSFAAGPVLNLYKGNTNAGFGANFFSHYFASKKVSIGPGIVFQKRADTDGLWGLGLRAAYLL